MTSERLRVPLRQPTDNAKSRRSHRNVPWRDNVDSSRREARRPQD